MDTKSVRLIAFYLPQFHSIPENDFWWGEGFTEWTNVRKARPLYPGHRQPKIPGELGYYDLRDPGIRERQARLAADHGIEGFCYWHYWFGNGKQLLERPFREVLESGEPRFPFCLGWANHHWTKRWGPGPEKLLMEQTYPGIEDHAAHFRSLEKAFHDSRYIRVDGKPLVFIFDPDLPRPEEFLECWRGLAAKSGLPGLYFIAHLNRPESAGESYTRLGFDAAAPNLTVSTYKLRNPLWVRGLKKIGLGKKLPTVLSYRAFIKDASFHNSLPDDRHGLIVPNWDDTPRRTDRGFVLQGSTPEAFGEHVRSVLATTSRQPREKRLVFIRSWNEWAEGNYLEPDREHGRRYLEILREEAARFGAAKEMT